MSTLVQPGAATNGSSPKHLVFGPKQYTRTTGSPNQFTDTFPLAQNIRGPFVLKIVNGDPDGGHRVSSATIELNGGEVLNPRDFSQETGTFERIIDLRSANTLKVTLASNPAGYLTISVLGVAVPPAPLRLTPNPLTLILPAQGTLTATLAPAPARSGRLKVTSSDRRVASTPWSIPFRSGQATIAVPVTAVGEGQSVVTVSLDQNDWDRDYDDRDRDDRDRDWDRDDHRDSDDDHDDHHGGPTASATVIVEKATPPQNRPPVAGAGGPYSGKTNQAITVTGTATDPDGDPLTVTWTFGDGATGSGLSTSHAYAQAGTYSATITADDGRGGRASASATVTITTDEPPPPSNHPPTANAGGPYSGQVGQAIAFAGTATDPDGDALTATWDFGDGSPLASGMQASHAYASAGTYTAVFGVSDGKGGFASSNAQVTVTTVTPPPNHDPSITSSPVVSATEGQIYRYDVEATDPDAGDTLTYALTQAPNGMAIDGATGLISWTPAAADLPSAAVAVRVVDGRGGSASQAFTIAIAAANHPPVFTSTPVTTASERRAYSYQATASDPDGDALSFTLTGAPAGMTIMSSGLIAWTPGSSQTGDAPVSIRVVDPSGASATQTFTIAVRANTLPSIGSAPPLTGTEGTAYRYDVGATDADGDPLTYALTQAPAGMTITPAGRVDWTPSASQIGAHPIAIDVSDDRGGHATQTFSIAVAASNRAPQIDSSPVTTAREGLPYSYLVHATDPNGDAILFALTTAPGGMTIDAGGQISWMPPAGSPASVPVVVRASDAGGAAGTQSFDIAVSPAPKTNQAPRITSTPDITTQAAQPYVYDVQAEDADAGDTLTFSLVQKPNGMTIDPASGVIAWTPSAAQLGPFAVIVRVSDGTAFVQQAYELTVIGAQPTNHPPSAHAGGPYHGEAGVAIAFNGAASSDPDGDPLSYRWSFGDGSAPQTGATPSHVYQDAGSFVVTLTVTDGRGGESARSTSVAIGAAGDHSPPSVTLNGPREVLPGDQATITAQAVDNVRVEKVSFQIDNGAPAETFTAPFQQAVAVPSVASPGATIVVRATAFDASGNTGSAEHTLTIKARPDTEKPTVTLNAPPLAAPGTTIHVSASAADNAGVQSVGFSINGASLVTLTQPPYEAAYEIPAGTPVGAELTVGAFALDFSANRTDTSSSVTIVQTPDTQPPSVQLSAATTIVPGAHLFINAAASDNRGVAIVDFYVDGVKIASDTDAPYSAVYAVPATALTGRSLQLEARATDFAGLEGTDSRQTAIVSASSLAQGVITGEVYDDTTGLPVEGAAIALTGADVTGQPYGQTTATDARGRYRLRAVEGSGILRIARDGWTGVDRRVDVVGNKSIEIFDARVTPLTPLSSGANPVNPVIGATLTAKSSAITLAIPGGALASAESVSVTAIGAQGLQGLLPAGWSVVGAADVTPHAMAFTAPATLRLPAFAAVMPGTPLVLARWHELSGEWRTTLTRAAASGAVAAAIQDGGQYVWLRGDTAPAAPPPAVAGVALAGVDIGDFPLDVTAIVSPESKVVLYQPGVKSDVTGVVTPASPVPSGTAVFARVSESYVFSTGLEAHPEASVQDLVLYQAPNGATMLSARHVVTPSIAFEPSVLTSGAITVELLAPATAGPRLSDTIGDAGGSATAETGERADVPAAGLTIPAAIAVRRLTLDDLEFALPAPFAFEGGLQLSASGAQFALPVMLSVPKPAQTPDASQILVVRVDEIGNATRLVLVAIGRIAGDRIESTTDLAGDVDGFEGARMGGRYLFLRPTVPVGFASGLVRAVNNDPFAGALVTADTLSVVALSRATGRYTAAAALGAVTLVAQDVARNDSGSAQGTVATAGVLALDLRLGAQPPTILSITPTDQAANVPLSNPVVVTFSEPISPASITPSSVVVAGPDGAPIAGTLTLSNQNSVVTFRPSAALPAETAFTVTVAGTIADLSGYTLGQAVASHFTSLDVTAPPPPAAGTLAATMPDTGGNSTVTGTQGTANQHDTVSILNVTRGTSTPVLVEANGGFSTIVQASLTDQLKLRIVDAAGNATTVALPRFSRTNADGSVSVAIDAEGGRVDGPGGVSATVKPGTFPDGAVVTIKPVPEAQFPVTLTAEQKQVFNYAGGVQLDFGGKVPAQYVDVSVPAAPGDKPGDQWVVAAATTLNGVPVLNVLDTAKLIDGKVTTASPPCPGVNASGIIGVYKSNKTIGVTYGVATTFGAMMFSSDALFIFANPFLSPFLVMLDQITIPFCVPVLSGRVAITPNSTTVTIKRDVLPRLVDHVVVKNVSRNGEESSFGRDSLEVVLTAPGAATDRFEIYGEFSPGSFTKFPFTVRQAAGGTVEFALDIDTILQSPSRYEIRNLSKAPVQITGFAADTVPMRLAVAGGAGDTYAVNVVDAFGTTTPAAFAIVAGAAGPGNLVARAVRGTIDPTQAEIDAHNAAHPENPLIGKGRSRVDIEAPGFSVEVPAASIVEGAFSFAFNGNPLLPYSVRVTYDDGSTDVTSIPAFKMTISNPVTGEVVKTITLPSPPADQPLNLGHVSDDHVAPTVTGDLTRFNNFDPSDVLSFAFSEPLDAKSVKAKFTVFDANGRKVAGDIRISSGNTVVTFVPNIPLGLGYQYVVSFGGVLDLGGNAVKPAGVKLSTIAPHVIGTFATPAGVQNGIRDIQIFTRTAGDATKVFLATTTNTKNGNPFLTLNVTDPANPTQAGAAVAGFNKRQLALVPGLNSLALNGGNPCPPGGNTFTGDMALTTSHTVDFTYVSFFDFTDETKPCLIANKILTATPGLELFDVLQQGTYNLFGVLSRGVVPVRHAQGLSAYTAIAEAGLFAVDVGANIPERHPRFKEPMLPGNYYDVAGFAGRLLALNRDARQLDVVDPTLAVLSVLPLPDAPRRIVVVPAFPFDANNNGTIEPGESVDAAFIGGDKSVVMVDITSLQAPRLAGMITMPTWIKDLDVDAARRRLVTVDIQNTMAVLDLTRIQGGNLVDQNLDGLDDRVIWTKKLTNEPEAIRIDKARPYIYVGTAAGLEIYALAAPNLSGVATYTYFQACPPGGCAGGYTGPEMANGGLDYYKNPAGEQRPIRGAVVELRDSGGALVQTTTTDDTGYYAFDVAVGQSVQLVLKAALARPENPTLVHLDVRDNFAADAIGPHAIGINVFGTDRVWAKVVPTFTVTAGHQTDFFAKTVWTKPAVAGGTGAYGQREAAPFAILDAVYQAEKTIRSADPAVVFPLLHMFWSPNNTPCGGAGQPACTGGGLPVGEIGTTAYHSTAVAIYVLGNQNLDTDEYDTQVMLHEWSHYFEANFSRSDSPGSSHQTGDLLDPRLAFGEGFATAHAAMMTGNPLYVDTAGINQGTGGLTDVENDDCPALTGGCAGVASGFFSEDAVIELLWDLFDPKSPVGTPEPDAETGGTIADSVELGYKPIYQVMVGKEKTTPALTSIFSFMKALTDAYASDAPTLNGIRALTKAENIDLTTADEYELSTRQLYTALPVDGAVVDKYGPGPYAGQPLQTQTVNDPRSDGNKLDCQVFFKFSIATPGNYEIVVTPTNNTRVFVKLYNKGFKTGNNTAALRQVQRLNEALQPGDYALTVQTNAAVNAQFKVSITLKSFLSE